MISSMPEYYFASIIAAKLAIANDLALPLAKLAPADRAFINPVLGETLNRRIVLARIRDFFAIKDPEKTMRVEVMQYYGLTQARSEARHHETEHHQQLIKDIRGTIMQGRLIAVLGARRQLPGLIEKLHSCPFLCNIRARDELRF